MEELNESRVWQRVRGTDQTEDLRRLLVRQARLRAVYRQMSRRGGKWRLLLEQKESQIACLRGLLRIRTGQGAACPRVGETSQDLAACFDEERGLLAELTRLRRPAAGTAETLPAAAGAAGDDVTGLLNISAYAA